MSQCQGIRGKWCIYAKYPVYTPKVLRYRWPGESWQTVINGDSYSVQDISRNTYRISGYTVIDAAIRPEFGGGSFSATYSYTPQSFTGTYVGWEWLAPIPPITFGLNQYLIQINYKNPPGDYGEDRGFGNLQLWPLNNYADNFYFGIALSRTPYLSIDLVSSIKKCRFTVFDKNKNIIFAENREKECPEVEIIPEKCEFSEPEILVAEYINKDPTIGAFIYSVGNCTAVQLQTLFLPILDVVAFVCGDCAPPQIRIDCRCEPCFDKKCPPGTVNKILTGGFIECVDANHCVIATVEYDPVCETPNCFC